jgi:hypothetical protein
LIQEEFVMSTLGKVDPPIVEEDDMQPQPRHGRGEGPALTGDTARQGPLGSRVLYVTVFGTIGAFVLLAIAFFIFASLPS